ncbi:MAG: monovalent cation/H+ antiporter complex subunit F [Defluviitaleaceae bacterium]|nr:monovalent cation/H+ antiporter complex subunit F [Defluviitaleaceae bacterium]
MDYFLENFLHYVIWAKVIIVAFYLIHVAKGPSIWDRLLGLNLIAAKVIMIIIVFSSIMDITFLLDLAILYGLFGFIGTIFIALFLSRHKLGKVRTSKKTDGKEGEA